MTLFPSPLSDLIGIPRIPHCSSDADRGEGHRKREEGRPAYDVHREGGSMRTKGEEVIYDCYPIPDPNADREGCKISCRRHMSSGPLILIHD